MPFYPTMFRKVLPAHSLSLALLCVSAVSATTLQPLASAQAAAGTIVSGYVLDPDQAAIPGATVTLTPGSGAALVTTSGGDGAYSFRSVPAGTYSITVTMQGFASFVRQGVRIGATPLRLNTPLVVQTQSQEINVTAQNTTTVSVDPDNNGSSVVIKDKDLEALSDDPDELSSELSALAGPSAGPNGGQIYVDGFTGGTLPPKSSIREIRVNQNPFSAQFDRQGFGRVEVFTKPGTDKYHGNLSIQGNAKFLNTSNPFLGATNVQPDYHRIFVIGSVTGPLTKTSSYSLAGSERIIQDNSIFAGQIVSSSPASNVLCAPGDSTCTLNTYPSANRATFHPQNRYDFTPRIDLALGEKNTLTVRYQFEHQDAQNSGLGSTSLYTTAYNTNYRENQIQISDTQILSSKVINETRFSFERGTNLQVPQSTAPSLSVQGYFSGGGTNGGTQASNNDRYELQNYTSVALRKNFIRAGLRYRLYRVGLFSTSGSNGSFTYANPAAYIANQPLQYSVVRIVNPRAEGNIGDIGLYAEDDWKAKSNLTVSYGIRYEAQSDINSKADLAPRLSVSYGIPRKSGNPLTVIRGGFGVFYDRFGLNDVINSYQQNGINQSITIYRAPGQGCSPTNITPCGAGAPVSNTVYQLSPNLRSAYNMQTAIGVDQQLPGRTTVSVNYINTLGVHQYLSRSIPVGGNNGQFVYQYQSGGVFRENQLLVNVRSQLSNRFSVFGFYALSGANGNANGSDNFPTDSLNPKTDYGRALFVRRNAVFLFGNWQSPLGFNFSPFLNATSGNFYNITSGTDLNGDTRINDRAGFANGTSGNCKNALDFTMNVTSGNRVPPGYCTGPAGVSFNLRAVKVFGFGERRGAAGNGGGPQGGPPGGGGGGPRGGGGGGRGGGGFGGGVNSGRKYTLNVGAQIQNLFNYVPYSTPVGTLSAYNPDPSKNLFGRSTSLTGFGPGGSTSAVRTITLLATFNF